MVRVLVNVSYLRQKEIKKYTHQKEIQLSLFTGYMITYVGEKKNDQQIPGTKKQLPQD